MPQSNLGEKSFLVVRSSMNGGANGKDLYFSGLGFEWVVEDRRLTGIRC
jgi:hypothetical protein